MKKALSITVLFFALSNIVGFMPLYYAALQEIKSEVKLELGSKENLEAVFISALDYSMPEKFRMTGDDEFSYNGTMYDFKEMKRTDGGYIFYCLRDTKEDILLGLLKEQFGNYASHTKSDKAPFGNLVKNFSKDFVGRSASITAFKMHATITAHFIKPAGLTCKGYNSIFICPPNLG